MYVVLTGAKINAGDYLIGQRGIDLLQRYGKPRELLQLDRWKPLDAHLEQINRSRALILLGGPAYKAQMYPNVFPMLSSGRLEEIRVPITAMGLGWGGHHWDDVDTFRFSPRSLELLARLHANEFPSSCRDHLTQRVLANAGFTNVAMTGCPAWYDPEWLGKPLRPPQQLKRIAFSLGVKPQLMTQNLAIIRALQKQYPDAELLACYHHGFRRSEHVSWRFWAQLQAMRLATATLGCRNLDLSGGMESFQIYEQSDLHVGYRVHAHIYCISRRRPTFLLHEDTRGYGASQALRTPGDVSAYDGDAVERLMHNIDASERRRFADFEPAVAEIESRFQSMRDFIASLP